MFNFYILSVAHDKVTDAGRAATCRLKFEDPSSQTKGTKNEGSFENMGFNRKKVLKNEFQI